MINIVGLLSREKAIYVTNRIIQNERKISNQLVQENVPKERSNNTTQSEVWCGQTEALVRACQQMPTAQKYAMLFEVSVVRSSTGF